MAGYLGTKAVLLSTTAADVTGDAEIGGDLTVGGNLTSTGIDDNATSTAITIDSSQNVGIGTSSPSQKLHIYEAGTGGAFIEIDNTQSGAATTIGKQGSSAYGATAAGEAAFYTYDNSISIMADGGAGNTASIKFSTGGNTERMRIDSSGNLLVGQSSTTVPGAGNTTAGTSIRGADGVFISRTTSDISASALQVNKTTGQGAVINIASDGSTVGTIGAGGGDLYITSVGSVGIKFDDANNAWRPCNNVGNSRDNAIDAGAASARLDDVYATNGTIQTSDRNEKQDIEVLSDAETRVAQACKGLLRKFRWKDAVAEKGDDARIHFGIIAQDLQDAFAAEGLDAGRYAMFISSTWWETQTEVPAVEAVEAVEATYDEDGNELTPAVEAVEAKEAYTRTDTYETQEEAPEGATERTRLGVRYPELLAFIIGAM
jgi:hypothetical protein